MHFGAVNAELISNTPLNNNAIHSSMVLYYVVVVEESFEVKELFILYQSQLLCSPLI